MQRGYHIVFHLVSHGRKRSDRNKVYMAQLSVDKNDKVMMNLYG